MCDLSGWPATSYLASEPSGRWRSLLFSLLPLPLCVFVFHSSASVLFPPFLHSRSACLSSFIFYFIWTSSNWKSVTFHEKLLCTTVLQVPPRWAQSASFSDGNFTFIVLCIDSSVLPDTLPLESVSVAGPGGQKCSVSTMQTKNVPSPCCRKTPRCAGSQSLWWHPAPRMTY